MNNSLVVAGSLGKARIDLEDATDQLSAYWSDEKAGPEEAMSRVATAAEALVRAISSVSLAVERLAELPVCEGVN